MGRSTQYIGLTKDAMDYVHKRSIRQESYQMTTGMFDEPVDGTIYHLPVPEGPNKDYYLREAVQVEPWSSGPMIFTHLEGVLIKDNGDICQMGEYFSWVLDPSLEERHMEYDQGTGRYYV